MTRTKMRGTFIGNRRAHGRNWPSVGSGLDEGAAERLQTLVNKKSRAARSKSNAARPSPTGGIQGVGRPPAVMKPNPIASHSEKENW